MAYDDELRGVGGWLAFFLVTLGIFTPGFIVITTLTGFADRDWQIAAQMFPMLPVVDYICSAVTIALCWFAVYRFLRVYNWNTVRIGIATLWAVVFINVVVSSFAVTSITGVPFSLLMEQAGPALFIRPLVYAGVWTAFLLNSVRVRNTYGQNDEETAEVFS